MTTILTRSLWLAQTNTYVLSTDQQAVVIDAPPDAEAIGQLLRDHDLVPVALVLTHGHVDHMGGAGPLQRQTGAAVFVHPDDDYLTLDPVRQLRGLFGIVLEGDWAPPEVTTDLADGEALQFGSIELEVRHTPGHTPGHCCFLDREEGVLYSGDQLFARSVGRTDLPGGDWDTLLDSMKRRVLDLDDDIRVLPGHGPETTIGDERRHNPFLREL